MPTNAQFICRMAQSKDDVTACQALRHVCFHGSDGLDDDKFDVFCDHVMVEKGGVLVCTLRMRVLLDGADFSQTYTGSFYDIVMQRGSSLEIGRFCVDSVAFSLHILRMAWAAITHYVDTYNITHIFGCVSFAGTDPSVYADAFGALYKNYLGKTQNIPKSIDENWLSDVINAGYDPALALQQMPPLLRTYLGMGGYVSNRFVVDHELDTLHIFAGLDTSAIPAARVQSLRSLVIQTKGLHMGLLRSN